MSKIVRRTSYNSTLQITAGSNKNFQSTVRDSSNNPEDLSDSSIFTTAKFNILEGNFTLIASVEAIYFDRPNGIVEFFIPDTIATNENAGNWVGELEFINELGETIDQKYMNFNILQSN